MRSRKLLTPILFLVLASCRGPSDEEQVHRLAEQFVHQTLALSPSTATAQGYHQHEGVALDEQLDDFSPSGIQRAHDFFSRSLQQADRLAALQLTPELQADVDVIRLNSRYALLDLEKIQSYRHNPTGYVETIGNAIYSPLVLNYAPEPKRLAQITARIEKIPAFLANAQRTLTDSPEIWNQVAQQENQGNIELIDRTIRGKIPSDLRARYDPAATNALHALHSFNNFLKNDLSRRRQRLASRLSFVCRKIQTHSRYGRYSTTGSHRCGSETRHYPT